MQGYSGSYAVNGSNLTLQPTEGQWIERTLLGTDGSGHPIYSGVRQFQLSFDLISPSDFNQLLLFYNAVGTTGTIVADLPQFNSPNYLFQSYSGCTLHEPVLGAFFEMYIQKATLLITNIRT